MALPAPAARSFLPGPHSVELGLARNHVRGSFHPRAWKPDTAIELRRAPIRHSGPGFLASGHDHLRGDIAYLFHRHLRVHCGLWTALVRLDLPANHFDGDGFP